MILGLEMIEKVIDTLRVTSKNEKPIWLSAIVLVLANSIENFLDSHRVVLDNR
jgi:hypothetical protein